MWASCPVIRSLTRWARGLPRDEERACGRAGIDELPLALECGLVSYDEETRLLTGEIVNVSVDERALDENGKLAVEKLHVITFDYANHGYHVLGEKVDSAFEDGKKFK